MYEYFWGHTKAQIELMTIDGIYTCYKKDEKKNSGGGSHTPPSPEKMKDVVRRWEENKKKRKFKLEDFLGGGASKPAAEGSQNKNE